MSHLLGLVTLPVIFWGTISLWLTLGQNPDLQMIMSEAPRDAFAWGTSVYRRLHSSREELSKASLYRMLQRPMSWAADIYPPERTSYSF